MQIKEPQIEKDLRSIKATMAFENMELNEEEVELCRKILAGEITGEEVRAKILANIKKV